MFPALGRVNVKNEEIDDMIKEAPGPINFTVFLTMFGEKLKGKLMCISLSLSLSSPFGAGRVKTAVNIAPRCILSLISW